ncbi:hypothetical protein GCM10009504_46670 [Pseudomonas laurentiana]|uniref:Uncharacterized protein n=1 Tax=Pseudomonas laurentiana TaxID=2364649 RepID=A0A6I5RNJ5_9PSED|nr:hypothetical protein [Pseudomonas laurentiana]NES09285.1 hypothetical protein [Pseudomonas laurentiana]GGU85065.1 hypothetical protein GCM10009504_46670 [Pseudomonas laurentiana]
MDDLEEKMKACEPLWLQAMDAVRRYNEAKGVLPREEVERLRLEAESLMQAVIEYQQRVLGGLVSTLH